MSKTFWTVFALCVWSAAVYGASSWVTRHYFPPAPQGTVIEKPAEAPAPFKAAVKKPTDATKRKPVAIQPGTVKRKPKAEPAPLFSNPFQFGWLATK